MDKLQDLSERRAVRRFGSFTSRTPLMKMNVTAISVKSVLRDDAKHPAISRVELQDSIKCFDDHIELVLCCFAES